MLVRFRTVGCQNCSILHKKRDLLHLQNRRKYIRLFEYVTAGKPVQSRFRNRTSLRTAKTGQIFPCNLGGEEKFTAFHKPRTSCQSTGSCLALARRDDACQIEAWSQVPQTGSEPFRQLAEPTFLGRAGFASQQ
jgi:hypothetical protein